MDIPKYVVLFIFLIISILFVLYAMGNVKGFEWSQFENPEKWLTKGDTADITTISINSFATGSLPNATRAATPPNEAYYVSEVACNIAKDVYDDFTRWGEYTRDNVEETKAFYEIDGSLCEYDINVKDYFCFVGGGKFNLELRNIVAGRALLQTAGCCDPNKPIDSCGCTHTGGNEYRLDEVCVNEVFNNLEMPPAGSLLPACTLGSNYIFIGVHKEKFGNNICYSNPSNCPPPNSDEGWTDWCGARCSALCDAGGIRDDGSPLKIQDTDRIESWFSDSDSDWAIISDSKISANKETVADDRPYFYIVYWNNSAKRYKIEIPRITPNFPDGCTYATQGECQTKGCAWGPPCSVKTYDYNGFLNFIKNLFDEYGDKRGTTAGMWYPELRTVFDSNVTLTGSGVPIVTNSFLGDLEAAIGGGIKFNERSCQKGTDCLDYAVNLDIYDLAKKGGDVYVRISNDVSVDTIPNGNYRIIVRNWISDLYRTTLTLTDEHGGATVKDARYMDRTIIICKDDCS